MIDPDRAFELVSNHVHPLDAKQIPLENALGYCLAEDIRADRDMPPADRAAMDGYAVRAQDLTAPACTLRIIGEVFAGSPSRPHIKPGTCVRIFTGANIPPGTDTVVMVEQAEERDGTVSFHTHAKRGANIFRQGEDAGAGEVLLSRGTILNAPQIGVCAAVGQAKVLVHRKPRIQVLCTGKELRSVRQSVLPHQMRNSNGPAICASLQTWGCSAVQFSVVSDDLNKLVSKLNLTIKSCDILILTGGVSVGKYDFVREAVERIGAEIRFHGVRMKPGKPCLYATYPENRHLFGLPGNPLSAMTGFHEFVLPALRKSAGLPAEQCRPVFYARLSQSVDAKGDRVRFILGQLQWKKSGLVVEPIVSQSSADLVAGGQADGVAIVPPRTRKVPSGTIVQFRAWRPLP